MIIKKNGINFKSASTAFTLNVNEVDDGIIGFGEPLIPEKTHSDGWTIRGEIHEDYYLWVNVFEAIHPVFGRVWGDFEKVVYADSEEGFADFLKHHPPEAWDYADI